MWVGDAGIRKGEGMQTTIQLYAKHAFDIPLPNPAQPDNRCRECGGIINGKGIIKNYSVAWAMDGYIFKNETYICPACDIATKGTATKALLTPSHGMAIIIHKDGIIPAGLEEYDLKKKKETLQAGSLTIKEALQAVPTLPVPYAIYGALGDVTKISNQYMRDIHMNYSNKTCLFYLVPAMATVKIDVETIFDTVEEMKAKLEAKITMLKETNKKFSEFYLFSEVFEEYKLSKPQRRLYHHLVKN